LQAGGHRFDPGTLHSFYACKTHHSSSSPGGRDQTGTKPEVYSRAGERDGERAAGSVAHRDQTGTKPGRVESVAASRGRSLRVARFNVKTPAYRGFSSCRVAASRGGSFAEGNGSIPVRSTFERPGNGAFPFSGPKTQVGPEGPKSNAVATSAVDMLRYAQFAVRSQNRRTG
jgi:hypothetical protein